MSYRIHGRRTETIIGEGATPVEAMANYRERGGQGVPEWMDQGNEDEGIEVTEVCESCLGPILEGEKYFYDAEGYYWHQECDDCPPMPCSKHGRLP